MSGNPVQGGGPEGPTEMDPQTARELLALHTAELLALPDGEVRRNTIDGERAVGLTTGLTASFTPLLPAMDATFLPEVAAARRADLTAAPGLARQFLAAEVVASAPWTPEQIKRRKQLAKRATANDQSLLLWFRAYLSQDDEGLELLAEVTPGTGVRDDARDASRVSDEVIARMDAGTIPQVVGPWTRESLRVASAEALELLTLLGDAPKSGSPSDLRNRAFTRWAATYERLLGFGRFLAAENPAVGGSFEGIYSGARKAAPKADESEPAEAPEEPAVTEEALV